MKTPYQRFWLLLKPDQKEIYQVYTYAFFKGVIALSLPIGIQSIINLIQGGQVSTSWMLLVGIVVLGIAMGGYMQLMQMRITETIQQKIFTRAAFDFTYRIPKIKFESIYKHYAPELMNRFFDVLTLQKSLAKIIIDFSTAILQIIFGLILLSLYHPFFILFSLLLIVLVFGIIKYTSKKGLETSLNESKYKYKVVSWLEELARSKDSFRLSGNTNLPELKTDERVEGYLTFREEHFKILKTQYILLLVFKIIIALGLLIVGGLLVLDQQMNIGQFVAAEIIILLVIDSSEKIILNLENIFDILTSLEKVGQVTDLELEDLDQNSSLNHIINEPLNVEIKNIRFSYPGKEQNVLNDFSFEFKSGKSYCLTGKNGSGKSTLLHLIAGLYQPQHGNVIINNYPIANYNINKLYKLIGNGLSEEKIFEGTLFENITLGRPGISNDQIDHVLKNLHLKNLVQSLPRGLDTTIETSGHTLSESVIQKILIARSIIHQPKLLLLENHIDSIEDNERKAIINFLTNKHNNWTLIAISNDNYFIEKADEVILMQAGELLKS
ncbi:MAG: ABC transporter ATP-binding protein [Bacteroidia bacterium]|nr:ABC transporter ATP-binding protein [Bacteroidia bacterium]